MPHRVLKATRKTGQEPFHKGGAELGFDVLSFWQWAASDLIANTFRGRLAEYIVAQALGVGGGVRTEWDSYDLTSPSGIKVEVKSCSYLQSWSQKKLSSISFRIGPARAWDPETGEMADEARHQADCYVFALLAHKDKGTLDPLDVSQWEFYVLPTATLNARLPKQTQVTLGTLTTKLGARAYDYAGLRAGVEGCVLVES